MKYFNKQKLKNPNGFTLAEVLITLVIIGVIAAITISSIIHYHHRLVVETKLKQTYSIIGNAFKMAQKDYGDPQGWAEDVSMAFTNSTELYKSFVQKYLLPYIVYTNKFEPVTLESLGYSDGIKYADNSFNSSYQSSTTVNPIILNNGTIIINGYSSSVGTLPNGAKVLIGMGIVVDINGPAAPNTFAKDVFNLLYIPNLGLLTMQGEVYMSYTYTSSGQDILITPTYAFNSPSQMLDNCRVATSSHLCGALIKKNGWVIPDDYPWKI